MAYNADIIVRLVETEVDKAVKSIERKLDRLQSSASDIQIGAVTKGTKELRGFERRIDAIGRSLERIKPTATIGAVGTAFAAGAGGAEKFAEALQGINNLGPGFGKVVAAINSFGGSLEQALGPTGKFGAALLDFVSSAPATAAGIGLATASLVAFSPAIKQATADVFNFGANFKKLVSSITSGGLVAFDSLNQKFEITRKGLIELAKGAGSLSFLKEELREAKRSLAEMDSTADEFRQETIRLIEAEKNVNNELRARKRIYDELTAQQRRVRENVEASRASRAGTGFGASDPVAKSIRRNQEKVAREKARLEKLSAAAPAPLALPSSDMLKAAERGLKNLKAETNKLGVELDYSNQEVANFINGLKKGANEAVKLPKIFDIVNASLKEAVASTQKLKSPVQGPGNDQGVAAYKERVRLTKLANNLEQDFTKSINSLKVKQNAARYRLEQRRIKKLADLQKATDRQRAKRAESLALGVGFPLLFGGGAGSVLGSAAGSFVGDGFGGQIAGGAVGQAIDGYLQSLGELGSALNPATADTQKLVEALGLTNSPFGDLIANLESSGREALALSLATQKMVDLVGQEGVNALKEFGEDTTRLGNEFSKAMTLMNAGVAKMINNVGLFKAIADQVGRANLINQARNSGNPEQISRLQEFEAAGTGSFGDPTGAAKRRREILQEIINAQIELNAQADREAQVRARLAEFDAAKVREIRASVAEKRIELQIEQLNAPANDATRIALEKKLAFQRLITEQQALYNQFAKDEITISVLRLKLDEARLKYQKQLASISNAAANYKPPKVVGVDQAAQKEAQAKKSIAAELTKQFELETKIAAIGQTKIQKINTELDSLDKKKALKIKELELSTEDARVLAAKLKTLDLETDALRKQLELQAARLQLEEKLADLKGEQTLGNLQRDLDQELASLTLPTGDAFEDERTQLALEQQQRYADVMAGVNDQIAQQHLLIAEGDAETAKSARAKLKLLEREKGIYEKMLPAIAAAEQQQLKFNQVLSMVEGPVNAFVGSLTQGLQGIIDGTMSAEEAFSNMLKNMGQALIDTAAQMIAQYIAIGIARAFAGMGSDSGGNPYTQDIGGWTAPEGSTPITSFGFRANGGPVRPNGTYMVGERGPELLTMGNQSGFVHSNTSEAMDRYRAGGSGGGGGGSLDVSYNVTQINGMNFVTEEQFRAGMSRAAKDGAKMGEAGTFKSMKNSRSNRRRVGI